MSIYLGNTLIAGSQSNSVNKDLSNLSTVGQEILDNKLNKQMISNCITHIPQDIKLELSGNVLTLKAGSKLYVPNGDEKFDEVITDTDIISTSNWTTGQLYVLIKPDTKTPVTVATGNVYSGTSAPSSPANGCVWYDTTNNVIKRYTTSDNVWTSGFALPICLVSIVNGTGFTSIDRVFNGIGYFGSTVYVLPNTKVLFPNGKNEDGSNKNIEYTETGVRLTTNTSYNSSPSVFFGSVHFYNHDYLGEFENPPSIKNYAMYYNISENLLYKNGDGGYWEAYPNMMYLGTIFNYSTNIMSANFKNTFRALDANNQFGLTRLGIPDYSKASSVTAGAYTATRDCVVYITTTDTSGGVVHTIYVDGVSVTTHNTDYNTHHCTPVYLKQNSKLTMSTYGNVNAYRVVPLFGAN